MNIRKNLLLSVVIGLFAMSCSENEDMPEQKGDPAASLQIKLQSTSSGLRSAGLPTQAQESTINTFTVYVYNAGNNILEKSQTFSPLVPADYTQTITGLTTGSKKVVVIANPPTSYGPLDKSNYVNLATHMFDLSTQTTPTNLAMSGEGTITLATTPNTLSINIARTVAKVQLGTITITPDPGNTGLFVLDSVFIMKAKGTSSMGIPTVSTGSGFYGGMAGTVSVTKQTFLAEAITGAINPTTNPIYFYVFPNDNTGNNATLLTLKGTYDGVPTYFPFIINDGIYITKNSYYTINVTIKRTGSGSADPETPVSPATLDITIVPLDWVIIPAQNVTW